MRANKATHSNSFQKIREKKYFYNVLFVRSRAFQMQFLCVYYEYSTGTYVDISVGKTKQMEKIQGKTTLTLYQLVVVLLAFFLVFPSALTLGT